MNGLVVVGWREPKCARNFTLLEALEAFGSFELNVVTVDLPESVTLRFNSDDQEVDGDVGLLAERAILLHQTDNDLCLFRNGKAVLRIVKPLVIRVEVHLGVLGFLVTISECRVGSTMGDSFPLAHDRELCPSAWENLAHIDLVIVFFPSLVVHPPVTIVFELIAERVSELGLVVPSLIFVTESTIPFTWSGTPRIPNVEQLKLLSRCHILHSK